jgi:hypothetical protein
VHALGKAPVNLITEIDVTVIGDRPVKLSRPARLEAFFEALAAMSDTAHLVQMVI